jgi:cysteine desulfurase/selenocysteine lyase
MATPDFLNLSEPDLTGASNARAAGLPDPALLTRLANEFFGRYQDLASVSGGIPDGVPNGLPNDAAAASFASRQPPSLPTSATGASALNPPAAPMGATSILVPSAAPTPFPTSPTNAANLSASSVPTSPDAVQQNGGAVTEADLRALAHDVSGGQPFGQVPSPSQPHLPSGFQGSVPQAPDFSTLGIPGGFSVANLSDAPSFSFLTDARSLFEAAAIAPPPATPTSALPSTVKIPTETDVKSFASVLPGASGVALPQVPSAPASLPQLPGVSASEAQASRIPFANETRSIAGLDFAPTLIPFGAAHHVPSVAGEISSLGFDVNAIRRDFPILQERVNGRPLIWLDNAATTQKPKAVIDRLTYFYEHENSNVHRAAHALAARASDAYDAARDKVRRFLNAASSQEIIFVRGATEGVNLVAQSWGRQNIQQGDEIVITHLEHHANIVPWQMLCAEKGARLRVAPVDDSGQVRLDEYQKLLNSKTRLVSIAHVSNALGTVTPVQEMVAMAHAQGAKVLIDGAQSVSHLRVDMQLYDCDFFVFSGHKVFAPTGIGVVYGKSDVLNSMPPWQGGGNMIVDVTFEKTVYHPPAARFEAGTGSIADAVGLGAAIDYLDKIGMANITRYEHELLVYATEALQRIPGLHLIGTAREKASVLSFVLDGYTTEEVGAALNKEGIAVRSGHHCAQPILRRFGLESTVRPSLAFYNTFEEIDCLAATVWNLKNGRSSGLV